MVTMDELRKKLIVEEARRRYKVKEPDPELVAHAEARHALHEGKRSHRPLSEGYELVGLAGEKAFCDWAGIKVDLTLRPRGKRINYRINRKKIDVLTARKPNHLLVEQGKVRADIYVLAAYRDHDGTARLLGWADKAMVREAAAWDVGGMGVISHAIWHTNLRPMAELEPILGIERGPKAVPLFELPGGNE